MLIKKIDLITQPWKNLWEYLHIGKWGNSEARQIRNADNIMRIDHVNGDIELKEINHANSN